MVKRIGKARRKTRHKLRQYYKDKGKIPLSKYFQEFKEGDKVVLRANLAICKGMYFPTFHGRVGEVKGKRGFCYQVMIKDGQKEKTFNVHPVHLTRLEKE